MRALFRALALRMVPPDWRETVHDDLLEEARRRSPSGRWPTLWFAAQALRIGAALRARNLRCSDARNANWAPVVDLRVELRHAVRSLRRAPWFACTVVGVMALVLTLATVVFAIVDGVLFRPLPSPDADRLFTIEAGFQGIETLEFREGVSAADLAHWSAAAPGVVFSGFSAARHVGYGSGVNDDVAGAVRVQPNIFDALGVRPMIGGFADSDFVERSSLTPVIITWDLWQGRFLATPDVIGHTVLTDEPRGIGFRIVGVMPPGFWFPSDRAEVQFLMPQVLAPEIEKDPSRRTFGQVIARAPSGMAAETLRSRVEAGMRATAAVFPDPGPRPDGSREAYWRSRGPYDRAEVLPLSSSLGQRSQPLFLAVFAAAMVLVGLGALNSSGLMAARALDRHREFEVRRALGASRLALGRIVGIETVVLLMAAALLALTFAQPILRFVLTLLPERTVLLKPWGADALDWRTGAFVALAVCALAVPTSIWPMRRAMTMAPVVVSEGGRTSDRRSIARFLVIAGQVAGAFVLIVIGTLLVGSLLAVYAQPLPIRTENIVFVEASLLGERGDAADRSARVAPIVERVGAVPGVRNVALTSGQALAGAVPRGVSWGYFREPARGLVSAYTHAVTADYYRILQPHLVAGRLPTDGELAGGAPVVVVGEGLAREYWPNRQAIGQILAAVWSDAAYTVIGVVKDVPWLSWDSEAATAYGPYGPLSTRASTVTLFVDVAGSPEQVTRNVLRELDTIHPPVSVRRAGDLIDIFADTVRARRFQSWLFGGFAAASLVVVGIGILGLLAMSTARRTKEVGIRQALGATPPAIVGLLVREQLVPVVAGLASGAVIAAWAVTFVESYLYQITTSDPRVWGAAAAVMLATAGLGALVPSVRASAVDPTQALRAD